MEANFLEKYKNFEISLAPMLEVTTSNFRKFVRLTSNRTVLFTEMIVANTVTHISKEKLIDRLGTIDDLTIVQLGGSDPEEITKAIGILKTLGAKNFNLNVGCPSSRVQKGCFGAILMKNKELVANIVNTVFYNHKIVLSLKIRVGVDEFDSYDFFRSFIFFIIENTPVDKFYVHARKCWLDGLSPKQNRNVPKLNYEYVYKIKEEFPHIKFFLNGGLKGIKSLPLLTSENGIVLDGMMIGREAIKNILVFKSIDEFIFKNEEVSLKLLVKKYLEEFDKSSLICFRILNPLQHILHGKKGTKKWKIFLNEAVHKKKLTVQNFMFEIENLDFLSC